MSELVGADVGEGGTTFAALLPYTTAALAPFHGSACPDFMSLN